MRILKYPATSTWDSIASRPEISSSALIDTVQEIMDNVKINKDKALYAYAEQFDKATISKLQVEENEFSEASKNLPQELKEAIDLAYKNITKFHASQLIKEVKIETTPGVFCWRKSVPIQKVGLYIPGGSAPLFSTILMLGTPAKIAGCEEVILCTPPDKEGKINEAILYTASLVGITKIYKAGGAQAIAAMAYGTESIPSVYKIFGPGNQYVTKAKELIQQNGIAIDMPAGPSEVLVIADATSNPAFVAADLLSQAEHGPDSQVILVSDNESMIKQTIIEIDQQMMSLARKTIAELALKNSVSILLESPEACVDFSNLYAPEHLIIATESAEGLIDKVVNAGSVFLGNYSCESAGDYASGTNHTLPTNGYSRMFSGVSLASFQKQITYQKLTKTGLKNIGPAIETMAEAEGLHAHKNAVTIRLKSLKND